jgi:hypothetical protein
MPFISGISMSIVTASGLSRAIFSSAMRAVLRDADDLDLGVGRERLGDEAADHHGVVDDEHPHPLGRRHAGVAHAVTSPSSASFSAMASSLNGLMTYSWRRPRAARTICACSLSVVTIMSEMSRHVVTARGRS